MFVSEIKQSVLLRLTKPIQTTNVGVCQYRQTYKSQHPSAVNYRKGSYAKQYAKPDDKVASVKKVLKNLVV